MKKNRVLCLIASIMLSFNLLLGVPANYMEAQAASYSNMSWDVTFISQGDSDGCNICAVAVVAYWSGQLTDASTAYNTVKNANGGSTYLQSATYKKYKLEYTASCSKDDIWKYLQNGPVIIGSAKHFSVVYGYGNGDFLVQDTQNGSLGKRNTLTNWIKTWGAITGLKYYTGSPYVTSITLTGITNQDGSITLNWDRNSKYGVYVRRGTYSGDTIQIAKVTNGKTFRDTNLLPSTTYYYFIQDIRADEKIGVFSNGLQIGTTAKLTAEYESSGYMRFSWGNNTKLWKTHTLNRTNLTTNKSENFGTFESSSATVQKSVLPGTPGNAYRYWVQPANYYGQGCAYSNYVYIYSLTYDYNDGGNQKNVWGANGGKFMTISDPVRTGYVFQGWYTAKTGGTKVSMPMSVGDKCQTVYAHWKADAATCTHSYGSWTTTKKATCTTAGTQTRTCSICGKKETKTIAATGHMNSDWIIDTEPQVGSMGSKHIECTTCHVILQQEAIPALECTHVYGAWSIIKNATCTEDGEQQCACTVCGAIQTQSIPATGHVASDWIIDTEPQVGVKGLRHKMCTVCHQMLEVEEIAALNRVKLSKCKVSLSKTSYVYNGKAKKPSAKVVYRSKRLVKNVDFTVKYSKNKKIGTAKVTITGKGNYYGTVTKTFKIKPKQQDITRIAGTKKGVRVYWNKKGAKNISGYQIRYSTRADMKRSKKMLVKSGKTGSTEIKNLKRHVKYYVQVRAYKTVNSKKIYSKWSEKWYVMKI